MRPATRKMSRSLPALALTLLALLPGCHIYKDTINPAFPVTKADAELDQQRMHAEPIGLDRPVVLIGGYRSPDFNIDNMHDELAEMTSGDESQFVRKYTMLRNDIEQVAAELVQKVDAAFPSQDENSTIEVDVIGLSMGGLVARFAADQLATTRPGSKKLRIRRLFTISTPHRGAVLAERVPLIEDRAVNDMTRSSLFLVKLDEAYKGDYEIIPYTRLEDGIVGAVNTAPPGRTAIWVSAPEIGGSHLSVNKDLRILTDIARRLRGEEPRGVEGQPLPDAEYAH